MNKKTQFGDDKKEIYEFTKKNNVYDINIPILLSRNLNQSNYTIEIKNMKTDEIIDVIDKEGYYSLTITCNGDYEGTKTCYILCI
jgi:hypothetical protein